jgi:hypothetical protein
MKRIVQVVFVVILVLLLSGCSEKNQAVIAPGEASVSQASLQGLTRPQSHVNLIPLPKPQLTVDLEDATSRGTVSARFGGVMSLNFKYPSVSGKTIALRALLYVPPGAVERDTHVTMSLDDEYVGVKFKPQGLNLDVPAKLDFSASGVDLSAVPVGMPISMYSVDLYTATYKKGLGSGLSASRLRGGVVCNSGEVRHCSQYVFGYEFTKLPFTLEPRAQ